MPSAADGLSRIRQQVDLIPPADQPADLLALVRRAERRRFPTWPAPALALCHGDSNIRNVVRRGGPWAAVDWEYSGWGDPAHHVAELIAHAAHLAVPTERWEWLIDAYRAASPDPGIERRIRAYRQLMAVWWAARLARILYEWPRGRDRRLVAPPAEWKASTRANYARYVDMAEALLA